MVCIGCEYLSLALRSLEEELPRTYVSLVLFGGMMDWPLWY